VHILTDFISYRKSRREMEMLKALIEGFKDKGELKA
jgi:hypothetical protein